MSQSITLRKNVRNLSDREVQDLRAAYQMMMNTKDNRGYAHIAGFHGIPDWYCWHHQRNRRSDVHLRLFVPWHRAYMYWFEQAAKDKIPDVSIPWWDWSSAQSRDEGVPKIFVEETIDEKTNPLFAYHMNITNIPNPIDRDTRRFPKDPKDLPSPAFVEDLLELRDFDDFSDQLQSVHDFIHNWTGGTKLVSGKRISGDMSQLATAAYDPIFWSHHSMVDRIWRLWQLKHGENNIPSELLGEVLSPFPFSVKQVLNVTSLGYDYASSEIMVEGVQ